MTIDWKYTEVNGLTMVAKSLNECRTGWYVVEYSKSGRGIVTEFTTREAARAYFENEG